MPTNVVKTAEQERLWNKAKSIAEKEGRAKDYAYIMGIFKRMGGLEKSMGINILQQAARFVIPGQIPEKKAIQQMAQLTAFTSPKELQEYSYPITSADQITKGLPEKYSKWQKNASDALETSKNELVFRQKLMSEMFEAKVDPVIRRIIFNKSLALWRFKNGMKKSFRVVKTGDLKKADPRGGKYFKRIPKAGGGYRYIYEEDKYKNHPDAHISGPEAMKAAIYNHIEKTAENGCDLKSLHTLARRYGAQETGEVLNEAVKNGDMQYRGGKLYSAKVKPQTEGDKTQQLRDQLAEKKNKTAQAKQGAEEVQSRASKKKEELKAVQEKTPEGMKKKAGELKDKTKQVKAETKKIDRKNDKEVKKSESFFFVDKKQEPLLKAVGHKYIRREPKPGGGYRYFYKESAVAREAKAGAEIRLGKRVVQIQEVRKDGSLKLLIDGKVTMVNPNQWHNILIRHYGNAFIQSSQRRAQQTINAVMRHVPRKMLEDLHGTTDEERLVELKKRVPAVYQKLEASFKRAGMSPFQAKRSLSMILERRKWQPEARALVIGTVIKYRRVGTKDLINSSENLAGGKSVHEGHVAAVIELRMPGGNPEAFSDSVKKTSKSAETELANLSKTLAQGKNNEAMAEAMASEAIQKLNLLAKAYPGLKDKLIQPAKNALLEVGSRAPKREGADTVVYVAGEGGKPKALDAKYKLVEADTLVASHDPESFSRNTKYPEDVQERAYHRDKAEQAKVIRNAQNMDPRFVVNTNPDAVNGPPMITTEGVVLGGNSRAMSMQRIYKMHPDKAKEMRDYLEKHAHEVGFQAEDIKAMKNPVLIREVEIEDKSKQSLQLLVRQMNESFTQGMDPRTMQVAMGRKLTDKTLQSLADSMEEDETLSAFLSNKRSERFVQSLFSAGIIDNRNSNQYMQKGTRLLNNDGKTLVARILVGRTVDDADILSSTGTQMMESIARAVPSMVQATGYGKGYDIGKDLAVAVDAFNDLQQRVDNGTLKNLDPKMSDREINQLYNYFDMLPGIGEPHPIMSNEKAKILLNVLIRKRGPVQMAKVFKEYAKIAAANPEGQTAMFGAKTSPMDALKQAAGKSDLDETPKLMLNRA